MGRTCAHPSEKTKQLCLLLEKGVCVGGFHVSGLLRKDYTL